MATGRIAQALAAAEGDLFTDIAADREAADALATSRQIDQRRDPLVVRMTKLFMLIRSDLNCPAHLRDFAVKGEAAGHEAMRLDRAIDEHDARAIEHVERSGEAGRRVVAAHETLLTGREPEMPADMVLPFPLDGGGL